MRPLLRQPLLRALQLAGCGLILLPVATIYVFRHDDVAPAARLELGAFSGLLHAAIYLILLGFFAASLRAGREPLVTQVARRMRNGVLPPELARYTRRVTWFWVVFCAAQIVTSLLLLTYAPKTVWSLFVTALNLPLIAGAMLGEYAYRRLRYRQYDHESLASYTRVLRQMKSLLRP